MIDMFSKAFASLIIKDPMNQVLSPDPQTNTGGLFIGDHRSASNIDAIKLHKIAAILSATENPGLHKETYDEHGIAHLGIKIVDQPNSDIQIYFEEAYEFISNHIKTGNVLIHCQAGISRSATLTLIYLMRVRNESYEKSLAFLKTKRKLCVPNPGFIKQLKVYAKNHGLPEEIVDIPQCTNEAPVIKQDDGQPKTDLK